MDTLYRVCQTCQGTGDGPSGPDGPACSTCNGMGFVPAYTPYAPTGDPNTSYPPVTNAPPANRAAPPQQHQSYQQQAQSYTPGSSVPTDRQQKFMEDLMERQGITGDQADEITQAMFGVKVPQLDKPMASKFIEELQKREQAARAAAASTQGVPF